MGTLSDSYFVPRLSTSVDRMTGGFADPCVGVLFDDAIEANERILSSYRKAGGGLDWWELDVSLSPPLNFSISLIITMDANHCPHFLLFDQGKWTELLS